MAVKQQLLYTSDEKNLSTAQSNFSEAQLHAAYREGMGRSYHGYSKVYTAQITGGVVNPPSSLSIPYEITQMSVSYISAESIEEMDRQMYEVATKVQNALEAIPLARHGGLLSDFQSASNSGDTMRIIDAIVHWYMVGDHFVRDPNYQPRPMAGSAHGFMQVKPEFYEPIDFGF